MDKNIEELTLLLMYLTSWDNDNPLEENYKECWKGYSFDIINDLTNKGYLFPSKYKNRSVTLTKEGMELAEKLLKKYIK